MITGKYCDMGYVILSDDTPIYSAGNCRYDSQIYNAIQGVLSPTIIRAYCEETADELAEERGEELGLCVEDDSCPELFSPDLDPEKI
jgi:hypothetical protein